MKYTLPDGTEGDLAKCRSCQADIVWIVTARGKKAPMNPDGTSHFGTCPKADEWRGRHR